MFKANNSHSQQTLMDSTQWMNPKIYAKLMKSWAPIFYEQVFKKIDEEPFAVLYGTTGSPNFPVNIILSLEYIKHMKNYNDLDLLDSFYFDYQVNYAVGIRTLGEINLAERTLYYFRERVYQYCLKNPDQEDILFGQFIKLLHVFAKEAKITLKEQRTDTTLFTSNIKKAGRMSLAHDVLVNAVKAIPEKDLPEPLKQVLEPGFKTSILYHSKEQDGDSKLTTLLNLCDEALKLLETLPGLYDSDEARITRRFLNEQSISVEDNQKLTPKPKKEISSGSLQSAYDEDATFRRKGDVSQSGYVLEISETCGKDNDFQLLTDYTVKPNNTSDVNIFPERIEVIHQNTDCTDMYVDGGFHSDTIHQTAEENGIEIHLTNMSGTEPYKKLPVTEFIINEDTDLIIQCPGGHAPIRAGVSGGQSSAHYPHETCTNCEFRDKCYSKRQVKDYVVRISLKAINTSRERSAMKLRIKENTSMRAGIEGSCSALKRTGLNNLFVRGITKCYIVSGLIITAQNIKRFIKHMRGLDKKKIANKPTNRIFVPNFS